MAIWGRFRRALDRVLNLTQNSIQDRIVPEVRAMNVRADYKPEKLAELILYASKRCEDSGTFGKTLLYKILFYSDFIHYGDYGSPITGTTYAHLPKGPAPEGEQFGEARNLLLEKGRVRIGTVDFKGYPQERTIALDEADMSIFSMQETATIDGVIDALKCHTATNVSDFSHKDIPWLLTRNGEEIPYHAVFVRRQEPVPMEYLAMIQDAARAKGIT